MTPSPRSRPVPVSVVVLTFNEERNLGACLESVAGWAAGVFVVDSGSTDTTVAIARGHGARIVSNPFVTHARQWRWALETLPLTTEWVLALDADQQVTAQLRDEIADLVARGTDANGGFVKRRQVFRGRWIKHGGYYPKYLLKLFRRAAVSVDDTELVDHHFTVRGRSLKLQGDVIEDNRNEAEIATWIAKHNRYAVLQARQEVTGGASAMAPKPFALADSPDTRVRRMKQVWARLPLFVRPCLYFVYRYIVRLGFLDGREGFVFHVLQAFWYRLLVDINIAELRAAARFEASERDKVGISNP
ncbi:MAG: glycosyltransferase family 2 protein [Vicinamibacterales bacterium]